jgi:hypothetical protein
MATWDENAANLCVQTHLTTRTKGHTAAKKAHTV